MRIPKPLFLLPPLLASVVQAETLTPLGDGNPPQTVPQTAAELWAGYDPTSEPLETEVSYQWEEDGVTMKVVRYRVGVFNGETAMVAGIYGFPTGQTNLPGLLQIHGGGQYADYRACLTNAKRGYATLSLAWAGRISATSPGDSGAGYTVSANDLSAIFAGADFENEIAVTTDWGPLEGYHAPSRFASSNVVDLNPADWTYDDVESPRNSTWFLWAMAARRGLTFLEQQPEVDGSKLGVYGHSMGGKLSVMTAGTDSRVKAVAPSCGGVSDFEKFVFYDVTIGDPPYLAGISCPVFFLKPSNDFHSHIADVPTAVATLEGNGNDWRVTTSPHGNHQDKAAYSVATQIWMDQQLKGGPAVPDTPAIQLGFDNHAGVPTASITGDNATRAIQSVEVYYTQAGEDAGEVQPFTEFPYRHWHHAPVQGNGANWTAELPVHSTDEPLWVFANVTYALDAPIEGAGYGYGSYTATEFVLSTPITSVTSAELQAAGVNPTLPATTLIEDFQGDWEKEWFNYSNDPAVWRRATHKVNDPVYQAPLYSKLAFDVRSDQANTLHVRMSDGSAAVSVPAGSVWQEVVLFPMDFQKAGEPWAWNWEAGKELEFHPAVWNGNAPEFRNLRWEPGTRSEYDERRTNKLLELPVEDGKIHLDVDSAEAVSEIYPTAFDAWFGNPGEPLVVDGVTYPRGMTVHAPFEATYFLGSAFDRFKGIATAGSYPLLTIQMKIYLDGELAFDSGDLSHDQFVPYDLDVSGVSEMRLMVSWTGENSNGAHGSWVDAHLTLPPSNEQTLFSEDFEGYGAPGGTGWDDFDGAFANSSIGFSSLLSGAVFQGANLLWFDNTTSPLGLFLPYTGTTSADDPANIQQTYAALSGTENVEVVFSGATGQNFVEGNQYELEFNYFNRPNLAGIAFVAELFNVATGTAVVTSSEFAKIGLNAYQFPLGTLAYTATAADAGAEIGIRFRGTPDTTNTNQLGLDNITLTSSATTPPDDPGMSSNVELEYAEDVSDSDSDLLRGLTPVTTGWVLGVDRLNDGEHGDTFAAAGNTVEGAYTTVGATAEFVLGGGLNGTGYDITSIQSIAAWVNAAFGNQAWTVEVRAVGGTWSELATVDYQPLTDIGATKYTLSNSGSALATGVDAIRFTADSVNGGVNDGAFVWREIDVFGSDSDPASELVPPTMVGMSPDTVVDGSIRSNVSTTTKLVAKFSEGVELGTGDITIVNLDTLAETVIALPDPQVTIDPIDPSLLMIEPSTELLENTRYAVCVDATVIDDLSGNGFAGILDTETWTFATRGANPLKVLCIGDSITVGYTDNLVGDPFNFGYRGHLYQLLDATGYVFQFVGESPQPWNGAFGLDPTIGGSYKPAFDLRDLDQDYHQGGEGATIGIIQSWFQNPAVDPDLVLLKIGINSIQEGTEYITVRDYIYGLVETIVTEKPDAHVVVAQIIPYSGDYVTFPANEGKNEVLYQYNVYIRDQLIPDLVAAGMDAGKVSTADMYSMFLVDPNDYTSAVAVGRHSNSYNHPWNTAVDGAGYDTMAQQWFDAIEQLDLGPGGFRSFMTDPAVGLGAGADLSFNGDPDGDGVPSGLEAWFGTNPGMSDHAGLAEVSKNGAVMTFEHPESMDIPDNVSGAYLWSLNLADWYGDNEGPESGPTVDFAKIHSSGTAEVTATASEELDRVFVRAGATLQD